MHWLKVARWSAALLVAAVSVAWGQPPDAARGPDGSKTNGGSEAPGPPDFGPPGFGPPGFGPPGFGPPGFGPPGFGPPGFPRPSFALKDALDKDHDGKIAASEIRESAESLKKLDKNHDGKLDAEEIGWPPRFPGFGPGGGRPGGQGGPGGPPFFGDRAGASRSFAERLMGRDANHDGKVTADELPKSMHWLIQRADQNKDGAIDQQESRALAERLGIGATRPDSK